VAAFLLLESCFPRSVRYCVHHAHEAIAQLRTEINPPTIDNAERILGRLDTQLEYAEMSEILMRGLPAYLQKIQFQIGEAAMAVQKAYSCIDVPSAGRRCYWLRRWSGWSIAAFQQPHEFAGSSSSAITASSAPRRTASKPAEMYARGR